MSQHIAKKKKLGMTDSSHCTSSDDEGFNIKHCTCYTSGNLKCDDLKTKRVSEALTSICSECANPSDILSRIERQTKDTNANIAVKDTSKRRKLKAVRTNTKYSPKKSAPNARSFDAVGIVCTFCKNSLERCTCNFRSSSSTSKSPKKTDFSAKVKTLRNSKVVNSPNSVKNSREFCNTSCPGQHSTSPLSAAYELSNSLPIDKENELIVGKLNSSKNFINETVNLPEENSIHHPQINETISPSSQLLSEKTINDGTIHESPVSSIDQSPTFIHKPSTPHSHPKRSSSHSPLYSQNRKRSRRKHCKLSSPKDLRHSPKYQNTNKSQNSENSTVLVVDTNILMGDLSVIGTLRSSMFFGKSMQIIVPYIVVEELDVLKTKKKTAQKAIVWLNSFLENEDPCIIGQNQDHHLEACQKFGGGTNDDEILNCCQLYKEEKKKVFLISNDVNLRNKCLIAGIKCFSAAKLKALMSKASPNGSSSELNNLRCIKKGKETSSRNVPKRSTGISPKNKGTYNGEMQVADVEKSITKHLGRILEHAMKDAFGEIWLAIVLHKPPWSATQILKCFEKHWIAVFIEFPNKLRHIIIDIRHALERRKSVSSVKLSYLYKQFTKEPYKSLLQSPINFEAPEKLLKKDPVDESRKDDTLSGNECKEIEDCREINFPEERKLIVDDLDQEKKTEEKLNNVTNINEHVRQAIIDVGTYSHQTIMEMTNIIKQPSNDPSVLHEVRSGLEVLRSTLVEFGYLLVSLKDGTNGVPGTAFLSSALAKFWELAHREVQPFVCDLDRLALFLTSLEGKEFLQCCISDLEKLIRSIDIVKSS